MKRLTSTLIILLFLGFTACTVNTSEALDQELDHSLNFGWKFAKGEQAGAPAVDFNDTIGKRSDLPAEAEGKRIQFLFDGVMACPVVSLNGEKFGAWVYGYNSFWVDATEAARFGESNIFEARVVVNFP